MATVAEVRQLYQDLLGRDAGYQDTHYWTQPGQGSIDTIAANIKSGDEYRTNKVKEIYDDFRIDADEGGVEHFVESGDDFQKIQDDIGTHFQVGGSRHEDARETLQDLYDDHFGVQAGGTPNKSIGTAGNYWFGEGGLTEDASGHRPLPNNTFGMGNWDTIAANIALHDNPYSNNDPTLDVEPMGDDEVEQITVSAREDIDERIADATASPEETLEAAADAVAADYPGEIVADASDGNEFTGPGTLEDVTGETVRAFEESLAGAEDSIHTTDLTAVQDAINAAGGDLSAVANQFAGLNEGDVRELIDSGYMQAATDLDSTFTTDVNPLDDVLNDFAPDGVDQAQSDLDTQTSAYYSDLAARYEAAGNSAAAASYSRAAQSYAQIEESRRQAAASASSSSPSGGGGGGTPFSWATQQALFEDSLKFNMSNQNSNFANLATDINSRLTDFSQQQSEKFNDVYSSRRQAIGELQTDWGNKLQKQEAGLQERIQMTADNLNDRLTNISSNMNYRMLGDSAAGIKMRRSKAFKTGQTAQGTGQMNRAMRIQTLNL
tara:strand:- start:634 stop:2283 length:1650 start_codon:yes stop_codon:yes gene_type:complete